MTGTVSYITKSGFEEQYLSLRKKEGRLYSDTELFNLPEIPRDHLHYAEWQIRKESAKRLRNYFEKRSSLIKILEIGCGNGWLSHQLAEISGSEITGTDVNFTELQQAARVFSHIPNLRFVYGGLKAKEIEGKQFDFVVFASSIQYFECLNGLIEQSNQLLKPAGEIHILDSPFYNPAELELARKRTEEYYQEAGFPEMSQFYFHHSVDSIQHLSPRVLYASSFFNRYLLNNKNPFQWICIRKRPV